MTYPKVSAMQTVLQLRQEVLNSSLVFILVLEPLSFLCLINT
jgi:hypothetical protein